MTDGEALLAELVGRARAAGADMADAVLVGSTTLSVKRRMGRTEELERSEARDVGLRVFVGQRQAIVSSTTVDPGLFKQLAERAVAMARIVPEDPFGGIGAADAAWRMDAGLDMDDGREPTAEELVARASAAEAAMMEVPGITNSEGGDADFRRSEVALVSSAGFSGAYSRTSHGVSAVALAGEGVGMQRDYEYVSAVHLSDLEDPAAIGRAAAARALARLSPRRPTTAKLPVVFDPRVAGSLIGHLLGAVNGSAVARGTSFLKDSMGQRVFAPGVVIRDDPRRARGLRSRPFDAEGTPTAACAIVDDGVLASWLLDSRSGRQLGLPSTGHAARGTGSPPSPGPSNVWMEPGPLEPAALMADIGEGLYVTELMGGGANGLTGDYSRGAAGFMIRGGVCAEPVSEITIAGRIQDMFLNLVPANDLRFRRGTDAPTIRVEGLTMAGA